MSLLDFVFPRFCLNCNAQGENLCKNCIALIPIKSVQECPVCRKENFEGKICCESEYYFDQLLILSEYKKGRLINKLIVSLKYKYAEEIAEKLGHLLREIKIFTDLIVPVPLDKMKLKQRGFNQAELLAKELGKVTNCIERKYNPITQASLKKQDRLKNLAGIFSVNSEVKGKSILLVDDVATTCSTLNECSKVLKKAGAKYICCLVLARGN